MYGIDNFSKAIQQAASDGLSSAINKITRYRSISVLAGAIFTALIQSSTAFSVLVVGLVESGALTFARSVPLLIGSNIGTTITAQLVAFNLMEAGPYFITLGFFISWSQKVKWIGRAVFYFGFVLFGLDMVGDHLRPLAENQWIINFIKEHSHPMPGVLIGLTLTILVQSSSVSTGLLVVLVQSQLIPFDFAVGAMVGANAGTTITAWLASRGGGSSSKKAAWAHIMFNIFGVLIFLPLLNPFSSWLTDQMNDPALALALGHTVFNLSVALIFISILKPYTRFIEKTF